MSGFEFVGLIAELVKPVSDLSKKVFRKVKKQKRFIKNNLRDDFFWYRGPTSLDTPVRLFDDINKHSVDNHTTMAFAAFNDRFSIFKASPVNKRHLKPQIAATKPQKDYEQYLTNFHLNYIIPFNYELDGNNIKNEKNELFHFLQMDRNIIWVLGEIGCGKSTFVSHLCHLTKQKINNNTNKDVAVITINFNKDKLKGDDPEQMILRLITEAFSRQFKNVNNINSFSDLNEILTKHFSEYKLNIIIDNLDELYDESSKLILRTSVNYNEFDKFYLAQKYQHIVIKLFQLIYEFNNAERETNVKFIICLRKETHGALRFLYNKITGSSMGRHYTKESTINIMSPNREFVAQTILKRFEITDEVINTEFKKFLVSFAQKAVKLKINGLRHVMENVRKLLSLKTERQLFSPEWMIDLYVYVDGYKSYAQRDCGVSNLFLVNINFRNDVDEANKKWPESTKKDHYQSYWLKYFIVMFLKSNKIVNSRIVRQYFKNYNPEIVAFSLYSLTEVNHGKLITCEGVEDLEGIQTHEISITDRLSYCLNQNMFFNYTYLSVIVEDDYIEFPKLKNEKLNKNLKSLFKNKSKYKDFFIKNNSWEEWLETSSKKVLVFFSLLRASFENYELELLTESKNEINPDFTQIEHELTNSIETIGKSLDLSTSEIENIIKQSKVEAKQYTSSFRSHFKEYAAAAKLSKEGI